jgi:hypothetical protein
MSELLDALELELLGRSKALVNFGEKGLPFTTSKS